MDDLLAVWEQLPEGWVDMDDDSRSRWVKEIPTVGAAAKLSKAESPAEWATLFGVSAKVFVKACEDEQIRHKNLTSKAYQVHVDNIPTTKR